nr:hypothetical protein [Bacteroidota bacterium]
MSFQTEIRGTYFIVLNPEDDQPDMREDYGFNENDNYEIALIKAISL